MNKLQKIKLTKNIKLMKQSTNECVEVLEAFRDSYTLPNSDISQQLNNVIKHQQNMVRFFGILENEVNK